MHTFVERIFAGNFTKEMRIITFLLPWEVQLFYQHRAQTEQLINKNQNQTFFKHFSYFNLDF